MQQNLSKMNPKKHKSININLVFSQNLLKIINANPEIIDNDNLIKLEINIFPSISIDEFTNILRTLERRSVIDFENKDDIFSIKVDNFIWVYLDKIKLNEFIKLVKEDFHGLNLEDKEKGISILKKLHYLINAKHGKNNQISIEKLKEGISLEEKDIKTIEWIADYTGFINIIYELEADFDVDELGRTIPFGAGEFPKKVKIVDIAGLKQLYEKLKKEFLRVHEKQIKQINIKNNIEWRCNNCSRFLDKLENLGACPRIEIN